MTQTKTRDWLSLSIDELEKIVVGDVVPEDIDWTTLPNHPQFERIFKVRNHPSKVARILLDSKRKVSTSEEEAPKGKEPIKLKYVASISPEMRERRLKLREEELAIAKEKVKNRTVLFEKVCQIETDVKTVKKLQKVVIDLLRGIDARARK